MESEFNTLIQKNQITFISDFAHSKSGITDYILDNIDEIQGLGVKHICLEGSSDFQPLMEQWQNGEITPDEYFEKVEALEKELGMNGPKWNSNQDAQKRKADYINQIETLTEHGIKIHFVDQTPEITRTHPKAREYIDAHVQYSRDIFEFGEERAHQLLFNHIEPTGKETDKWEDFCQFSDTLIQQRTDANSVIAENINAAIGDEKAIVRYGGAHINKDNDIDEMLDHLNNGTDRTGIMVFNHDTENNNIPESQRVDADVIYNAKNDSYEQVEDSEEKNPIFAFFERILENITNLFSPEPSAQESVSGNYAAEHNASASAQNNQIRNEQSIVESVAELGDIQRTLTSQNITINNGGSVVNVPQFSSEASIQR